MLVPRIFVEDGVGDRDLERLAGRFVDDGFELAELRDLVRVQVVNWTLTLGNVEGAKLDRARHFFSEVSCVVNDADAVFERFRAPLWAVMARLVSLDALPPRPGACAALLRTLATSWEQVEGTQHVCLGDPFEASSLLQRVSPGMLHAWGDPAEANGADMLRALAERIEWASGPQITHAVRETMLRMGYSTGSADAFLDKFKGRTSLLASCPESLFSQLLGSPQALDAEEPTL